MQEAITLSNMDGEACTPYSGPERVLYYVNGSIPSWRVMLLMRELGVDATLRRLRVMVTPKETQSPEFLAINPKGGTPTLVDIDGAVLTEHWAIMHYLTQFHPKGSSLMLTGCPSQYATVLAKAYAADDLRAKFKPLDKLFFQRTHLNVSEVETARNAHHDTMEELKSWDRQLVTTFVAGESFSFADCAFYPVLAYQVHRGLDLNPFPNLERYYHTVYNRTSALESLPNRWEKPSRRSIFKRCSRFLETRDDTC